MPDYFSEENWNAFLALWSEETRVKAPSYFEAAKNLDEVEQYSKKVGMVVQRVKVEASEWERWVRANGKPLTRESVTEYAMRKFLNEL